MGRLGVLVVSLDEVLDGVDERTDAGVASAFDLALGQQAEPAFDLVEPGGVGGREMKMIARALQQPAFDEIGLVRGIVVEHQMDFQTDRDGLVDEIEKLAELLAAMFGKALADDLAGGQIQGRKKTGGAMTKVVRRAPFELAGPHGENGLGTAQGLDLALLVHAEHQGIERRAQIEAHDVAHLLDELRILREHEGFAAVRL